MAMGTNLSLKEKLEDARSEVARLERAMQSADCIEAGHDWVSIGGANAGCNQDFGCSVPVFECRRCGASDYGVNDQARAVITDCAINHGPWTE